MNQKPVQIVLDPIIDPESDLGHRKDSTGQRRWIRILHGNLAALLHQEPDVSVLADAVWHPVPEDPDLRVLLSVAVIFGRSPREPISGKLRQEQDGPPTVVFDVTSPAEQCLDVLDRIDFYREYGVEEAYVFDPSRNRLLVLIRQGPRLRPLHPESSFVSPRLKIRLETKQPEMVVYRPDGSPFLTQDQLDDNYDGITE